MFNRFENRRSALVAIAFLGLSTAPALFADLTLSGLAPLSAPSNNLAFTFSGSLDGLTGPTGTNSARLFISNLSGSVTLDFTYNNSGGSANFSVPVAAGGLSRLMPGQYQAFVDVCGDGCNTNMVAFTVSSSAPVCPSGSQLDSSIIRFAGTGLDAHFTPPGGLSLTDAAIACGFIEFNWTQTINVVPSPSPVFAANAPTIPLTAPPPFRDPVSGGYTYISSQLPPFYGAFPFYYNASVIPVGCAVHRADQSCEEFIVSENTLNFFDQPSDPCLPGGSDAAKQLCGFSTAPPGGFVGFTTALVGVYQGNVLGPTLYEWTWTSTFNGRAGGVATFANTLRADPGTGTGGVTITSTNGVPYASPIVACNATPNSLWPPNGKPALVTVTGNVTGGAADFDSGSAKFWVTDEYGEVQPRGSVALGAGGSYAFQVSLIAARDGNDQTGRTYMINVGVQDNIGSLGTCVATVTVPHDQAK